MSPQKYRKKPVEVEAMQWDGSDQRADDLYEWTAFTFTGASGGVSMQSTRFMVFGEDDAYEVFRCWDDEMELIPGNEVDRLSAEGFTATLYVGKSGQWAHLHTGDWVIAETDGGHYPCAADVFAATYEAVQP